MVKRRIFEPRIFRMGSGYAGEFYRRFYLCSFGKFVLQICSAWSGERDGLVHVPNRSGGLNLAMSPNKMASGAGLFIGKRNRRTRIWVSSRLKVSAALSGEGSNAKKDMIVLSNDRGGPRKIRGTPRKRFLTSLNHATFRLEASPSRADFPQLAPPSKDQ